MKEGKVINSEHIGNLELFIFRLAEETGGQSCCCTWKKSLLEKLIGGVHPIMSNPIMSNPKMSNKM